MQAGLPPPPPHAAWPTAEPAAPMDQPPWGQQQQQQPAASWGPSPMADYIPAEWGGWAHPLAAGPATGYAATWPPPGHAMPLPGMPGDPQMSPCLDSQQAYMARVPWQSSWPEPEAQVAHDFQLAGAADGIGGGWGQQQGGMPSMPQFWDPSQAAMQGYAQAPPCYQPAFLPGPVFAISAPQPAPPCKVGLARKKKAALPAEPSFGCDNAGLDGGASAVLLQSEEASVAGEEALLPPGSSSTATPRGSFGRPGWGSSSGAPADREGAAGSSAPPSAAGTAAASGGPSAFRGHSIEFDKAPRPVDWQPYNLADYRQRSYDAKQAAKYWALGGLGPARLPGDAQWQAERDKRERQQQFGQAVSKQNREKLAASQPRQREPPARPGAEVRERALTFAKTAVPRPGSFSKGRGGSMDAGLSRSASGAACAAAAAAAQAEASEGAEGRGAAAGQEAGAVMALGQQLGGLALGEKEAGKSMAAGAGQQADDAPAQSDSTPAEQAAS